MVSPRQRLNPYQLQEEARSRQIALLAQLGAMGIQDLPQGTAVPQPTGAMARPDEQGKLDRVLNWLGDPGRVAMGAMTGAAAYLPEWTTGAVPWRPDPVKVEAREQALAALKEMLRGGGQERKYIGDPFSGYFGGMGLTPESEEGRRKLLEAWQRKEPTFKMQKGISEAIADPLNIPLGVGAKALGWGLRGTRALGKKGFMAIVPRDLPAYKPLNKAVDDSMAGLVEIKEADQMASDIIEQTWQGVGDFKTPIGGHRIPGAGKVNTILTKMGLNSFDRNNPMHVALRARDRYSNGKQTFIDTWKNTAGWDEGLQQFKLDDFGRTQLVHDSISSTKYVGKRIHFDELVQHPDKYKHLVTEDQSYFLKNIAFKIGKQEKYLIDKGVDPDFLINRVPGSYFPDVWQFQHEQLLKATPEAKKMGIFKPTASYLKSRLIPEASDAIHKKGYSAHPTWQLDNLLGSQYERFAEHQLVKILAPETDAIARIMQPKIHVFLDDLGRDKAAAIVLKTGISKYRDAILNAGKVSTEDWAIQIDTKMISGSPKVSKLYNKLKRIYGQSSNTTTRQKALTKLEKEIETTLADTSAKAFNAGQAAKMQRALINRQNVLGKGRSVSTSAENYDAETLLSYFDTDATSLSGITGNQWKQISKEYKDFWRQEVKHEYTGWKKIFIQGPKKISTVLRTTMTGIDLSFAPIQGLVTLTTDPGLWARSYGASLKAFGKHIASGEDTGLLRQFAIDHSEAIADLRASGLIDGASHDILEGLAKDQFLYKAAQKVADTPYVSLAGTVTKRGIGASYEGFNTMQTMAKVHLYEGLRPLADLRVQEMTDIFTKAGRSPEDIAKATREINHSMMTSVAEMTGTVNMSSMGISQTAQDVMRGWLSFAPTYRLSVFSLIGQAVRGGFRSARTTKMLPGGKDRYIREMLSNPGAGIRTEIAMKAVRNLVAAGTTMYLALCYKLKQEPKLNPIKDGAEIFSIQVGDTRMGIGGAYMALARLHANMIKQYREDGPTSIVDIREGDNPFRRFVRSQIAPFGGLIWEGVEGRNYMGDPIWGKTETPFWLSERITPMWMHVLNDTPSPGLDADLPTQMAAEFMGLRAYPTSLWDRAESMADIQSYDKYKLKFSQLDKLRQKELLVENPDIQRLLDENNDIWGNKGGKINEYRRALKDYDQQMFNIEMAKAIDALQSQQIDRLQFRELVGGLHDSRRSFNQYLKIEHKEAVDLIKEKMSERKPEDDAYVQDLAYQDYLDRIVGGEFEDADTGDFLHNDRNKAIDDFKKEWGDDMYAYIRDALMAETNPVLRELYDGRDNLRPYWEVGESILKRANNAHYLETWHDYQRQTKEEKEVLEVMHPWIKDLQRAIGKAKILIKERNPTMDRWLYRWGYSSKVRHPNNQIYSSRQLGLTPVYFDE